jgi:hypothetical protein
MCPDCLLMLVISSSQYTHDVAFSCTAPRIYSPYTLDMERPVDAAILFELSVIASRSVPLTGQGGSGRLMPLAK